MKLKNAIILFIVTLLLSLTAYTQFVSPLPPWLATLYGDISISSSGNVTIDDEAVVEADLEDQDGEGLYAQRVARFIYDVAADGGATGARSLGVQLPANAVITRSYFKIITAFTSGASGGGTVALSCEDANNIKTATDLSSSSKNAFLEGQSTGASSAFVRGIAAACNITATVASTNQTAGKLVGWVEYMIEE